MNLFRKLERRAAEGRPLRVGLIGAGKFGTMFLAQARTTPGLQVLAVADLDRTRAAAALGCCGWSNEAMAVRDSGEAYRSGGTWITEDAEGLIAADGLEVVIEATGDPRAGIRHARLCRAAGRHVVMVNVEADALVGPLLAREAEAAGLVYSLAYGDQPAIICELVDWARACGFEVVAAGKGTKYLPIYHASTPDTVWDHYYGNVGDTGADMNAQMFNSFLDGTKSAIEMAAVANACGLDVPSDGLGFPPCGVDELPQLLRPAAEGGVLAQAGQVEVISCLNRDGSPVAGDLRWGVYVVFRPGTGPAGDYAARCLAEYGMVMDESGRVAALYRPYHLIGLELNISVLSAGLAGEATGAPQAFRGDVAAVAKRKLAKGEVLDGEGGYMVWGKLLPAETARAAQALPMGLAKDVTLVRDVAEGALVRLSDVRLDPGDEAVQARGELQRRFAAAPAEA